MGLNIKIRALIVGVVFTLSMLTTSYTHILYQSDTGTKNKTQYISDYGYEKYQGEKLLLKGSTTSIIGSYGRLNLTPYIIQPSADFIMNQVDSKELFDTFTSGRQWIFRNATQEEIQTLFKNVGLDDAVCADLLSRTVEMPSHEGYITTPGDAFFWSLTPEIKENLYPLIGNYSDNIMYSQPLYYYSDSAEEWFYNSGLRDEVKGKILSLVYSKNRTSYLSDVFLILPYLEGDEGVSLLKAVYRTKSVDAVLKIGEGQDVSSIAAYWGSLGRTSEVESLLQNLSSQPGGGEISIDALLPVIPRERINTYCGYEEFETDWKDCHWTTINFFNSQVDERYYDFPDLLSFIEEISEPVKTNSQLKFGDIVCIFDSNNTLVHSCIYIADNLVLTKNGMGNLKPFIISYLDKTVSIYGDKSEYLSRTVADTNAVG